MPWHIKSTVQQPSTRWMNHSNFFCSGKMWYILSGLSGKETKSQRPEQWESSSPLSVQQLHNPQNWRWGCRRNRGEWHVPQWGGCQLLAGGWIWSQCSEWGRGNSTSCCSKKGEKELFLQIKLGQLLDLEIPTIFWHFSINRKKEQLFFWKKKHKKLMNKQISLSLLCSEFNRFIGLTTRDNDTRNS